MALARNRMSAAAAAAPYGPGLRGPLATCRSRAAPARCVRASGAGSGNTGGGAGGSGGGSGGGGSGGGGGGSSGNGGGGNSGGGGGFGLPLEKRQRISQNLEPQVRWACEGLIACIGGRAPAQRTCIAAAARGCWLEVWEHCKGPVCKLAN